jgi:Na+-driven multidrug efflux pump
MNLGWEYLVVNSVFYTALVFVNVVRFMIQGMGYSMLAILAGVMEMIGRSWVAFMFVPKFGFIAACFASPIAWIFADCFLWPCYFYVRKKIIRMLGR